MFNLPASMGLTDILSLAIAAILVNNYILVQFLGCCSFFGVSKKTDTALGMGMAVIFVMAIASAASWAVQYFILEPLGLGYMQTIAFILVIATLVQFVEMFMKKAMPSLYSALGIFLPLITTNCAVLGAAKTNISNSYSFIGSLVYGVAAGVGYTLAIVLFASIRERLTLLPSARSALKASRSRWLQQRCWLCPSWASPACRFGKEDTRNGYAKCYLRGSGTVHHGYRFRNPARRCC